MKFHMVVAGSGVPQNSTVTLLHSVVVKASHTEATFGVVIKVLVGTPSFVVVAPVRVPVRVTEAPMPRSKGVTLAHWSLGGWAEVINAVAKKSRSSVARMVVVLCLQRTGDRTLQSIEL